MQQSKQARNEEAKDSKLFFCCETTPEQGGNVFCICNFATQAGLNDHLRRGHHKCGKFGDRLHSADIHGTSTIFDAGCKLLFQKLTEITSSNSSNSSSNNNNNNKEIDDPQINEVVTPRSLFDGSLYAPKPRVAGCAVRHNYPSTTIPAPVIEAVYQMKRLGDNNKSLKFTPESACDCMRFLGQPENIPQALKDASEYFSHASEDGKPIIPRDKVLEPFKIRELFQKKTSELEAMLHGANSRAQKALDKQEDNKLCEAADKAAIERYGSNSKAIYAHRMKMNSKTASLHSPPVFKGLGEIFWKHFAVVAPSAKDLAELSEDGIVQLFTKDSKVAKNKLKSDNKCAHAFQFIREFFSENTATEEVKVSEKGISEGALEALSEDEEYCYEEAFEELEEKTQQQLRDDICDDEHESQDDNNDEYPSSNFSPQSLQAALNITSAGGTGKKRQRRESRNSSEDSGDGSPMDETQKEPSQKRNRNEDSDDSQMDICETEVTINNSEGFNGCLMDMSS